MTLVIPIIPEDSWVVVAEWGTRREHKVFATNGDVLTHCQRWLKREDVAMATEHPALRCRLCEESA